MRNSINNASVTTPEWTTRPERSNALAMRLIVWIALMGLALLSFGLSGKLGHLDVPFALGIAVVKSVLVVLFFMHVRHSTRLTKLVLAGGVLWFLILMGMTYTDFASRTWMGVPGR